VILEEAVREPADSARLFTTLLDRFGALGGVDLALASREESARAADAGLATRNVSDFDGTAIEIIDPWLQ
jgi:hypothetical protein